jgi:hypothetical protein
MAACLWLAWTYSKCHARPPLRRQAAGFMDLDG